MRQPGFTPGFKCCTLLIRQRMALDINIMHEHGLSNKMHTLYLVTAKEDYGKAVL